MAHLHPHLHVLLTDGAFRRDGTFVPLPEPDAAVLEESWRRAVLAELVRHGWPEEDAAAGMLAWPLSGFGAYLGPRIEPIQKPAPQKWPSGPGVGLSVAK